MATTTNPPPQGVTHAEIQAQNARTFGDKSKPLTAQNPLPLGTGPFQSLDESTYTWAECFKFTKPKILAFVQALAKRPDMTVDREVNGMKLALDLLTDFCNRIPPSKTNANTVSGIKVMFLKALPGSNFDPNGGFQQGTTSTSAAGVGLDPLWLKMGAGPLPHFSVFDLLGWCMAKAAVDTSKTAGPVAAERRQRTDENYYLPLLALFSQWAQIMASITTAAGQSQSINNELPAMLCITWFQQAATDTSIQPIILGATIPQFFRDAVQQDRLKALKSATVKGQPKDVRPLDLMKEPAPKTVTTGSLQKFGHCAETNQFLIYCYTNPDVRKTIHGLSMQPQPLPTYTASAAADNLRDPCINCQSILRQFLGGNTVLQTFGVGQLQRRLGIK